MDELFKLEAVLVVLLAILAVVLFPAHVRGPYSVTHGIIATLRTRAQNFLDRLKTGVGSVRRQRQAFQFVRWGHVSPAFPSIKTPTSISVLRI